MTICLIVGLRRHASSSAQVPRMFVSSGRTGLRFATLDRRLSRQVKDGRDLVFAERALECRLVAHVAPDHPDAVDESFGDHLRPRNPVADQGHDIRAGVEELSHDPAADEAGRARHEDGPVPPEGRRGLAIPRRQCESPPERCCGPAGPGRCRAASEGDPRCSTSRRADGAGAARRHRPTPGRDSPRRGNPLALLLDEIRDLERRHALRTALHDVAID